MSSVDWCVAGLEPEVEVLKGDAGAGDEDGGLVVGVGVAVGHGLTGMLPKSTHRWVAVEVADDDDALVLQPLIEHALHERGTLGVGQGIDEDKGPFGTVKERRHIVEQGDLQFHIGQVIHTVDEEEGVGLCQFVLRRAEIGLISFFLDGMLLPFCLLSLRISCRYCAGKKHHSNQQE